MRIEDVEIRDVDPEGVDAAALLRDAFEEARLLYPDLIAADAAPPRNEPLQPRSVYVVAYTARAPVACGALRQRDAATAELRRVYVRREHRRRGLARNVLDHLLREAKRLGYQRVVLETGNRQAPAMRLYESHGFGRIPVYGEHVGDPTSVCYERALPTARDHP